MTDDTPLAIPTVSGTFPVVDFDVKQHAADLKRMTNDEVAEEIVVSAKIVGIVLISAFLVIPPAAARLVSIRFMTMTLVSIVLGAVTGIVGWMGSYSLDLPSGAAIILVQTIVFLICFVVATIVKK